MGGNNLPNTWTHNTTYNNLVPGLQVPLVMNHYPEG